MALLTRCGTCDQAVVGVIIGQTGRYSIECKQCGYSAVSRYCDAPNPPAV